MSMDISQVKRLIALSPEGARLLGIGVYRQCSQARIDIAAQAALADPEAGYTPEERRAIMGAISGEAGELRSERFELRLAPAERVLLDSAASRQGMTAAEYLRSRIEPTTEGHDPDGPHIWRHNKSGERFVVTVKAGHVTDAVGPLYYSEIEDCLQNGFNSDAELVEDIDADQDSYALVER